MWIDDRSWHCRNILAYYYHYKKKNTQDGVIYKEKVIFSQFQNPWRTNAISSHGRREEDKRAYSTSRSTGITHFIDGLDLWQLTIQFLSCMLVRKHYAFSRNYALNFSFWSFLSLSLHSTILSPYWRQWQWAPSPPLDQGEITCTECFVFSSHILSTKGPSVLRDSGVLDAFLTYHVFNWW